MRDCRPDGPKKCGFAKKGLWVARVKKREGDNSHGVIETLILLFWLECKIGLVG